MKTIIRILAVLAALLVMAIAAVALFFDANQFRPTLEAELTKSLAREVKLGDLKLALWSGSVTARNLSIADDPKFSTTPFLEAKSLKVDVELKPLLLSRKLNVTGLSVVEPQINLLQHDPGEWNYATFGKKASPSNTDSTAPNTSGANLDLAVKLIKITDGRLSVGKPKGQGQPQVFEKVNAELRDFSAGSSFPFELSANIPGGAELKLDGKAGPIGAVDTSMTPMETAVKISKLDLRSSGFLDPSSPLAGVIDVDGAASSDGRWVDAKGKIKADRLRLAKDGTPAKRQVEFDFALRHDMVKRAGSLSRGLIQIGKSDANLTGSYALRTQAPQLGMKLAGSQMAIAELMEMLPPMGIVLPSGSRLEGGTALAKLSLEGPANRLTIDGPVGLNDTRLAGFDLGSKLRTIATLAGIKVSPDTDIQRLSANVRSTPGGTAIDDLTLVVPSIGQLNGSGAISPSNELDFKMKVTLHTTGAVMAAIGQRGDTIVPFFVRGTSAAPSFVPDVKGIASGQAAALLKNEKVNAILEKSEAGKAAKGLLEGLFGRKKQ